MVGGSEEVIILFAEELAKRNFEVTVFHTKKKAEQGSEIYNGVIYREEIYFRNDPDNITISFKSLSRVIDSESDLYPMLHWSCEVEGYRNLDSIDKFIHISKFHRSRHGFISEEKSLVIPLGIDKTLLDQNKTEREPNTILFCSSPDRGLFQLLNEWGKIKEHFPIMKLRVAYGFDFLDRVGAFEFKNQLLKLMDQQDIQYLGALSKEEIAKEYWKNQYWCLPLQTPESELFCLNAIKSKYCGAIPIVNKIGALKETVGEYIKFTDFIQGSLEKSDCDSDPISAMSWSKIIDDFWLPLLIKKKDEK